VTARAHWITHKRALVFEGLRQSPVVERHVGRDAPLEQPVDESRVEVEPLADSPRRAVGRMRGHATEKRYALWPSDFIRSRSSRQRLVNGRRPRRRSTGP